MRLALPRRIDETAWRTRDPAAPLWRLEGETMGTVWRLVLAAPKGLRASAARGGGGAAGRSGGADEPLGTGERPVPLQPLPAGTWVALPADFARDRGFAGAGGGQRGRLQPRAGAAGGWLGLWPARPGGGAALRRRAGRAAAAVRLAAAGFRGQYGGRLRQPGGLSLDLSGIAKGYAADALADLLAGMGVAHGLAEVGGELAGRGFMPDGQPWWVELENPPGTSLPALRVALHGLGGPHRAAMCAATIWTRPPGAARPAACWLAA
jgi:thiamine biosynthesis lipoprotein